MNNTTSQQIKSLKRGQRFIFMNTCAFVFQKRDGDELIATDDQGHVFRFNKEKQRFISLRK